MIPRFKKVPKVINPHLNKEQFLEEHNRLSPVNLRGTISLLSRFRIEKASLFKDENWSIDKLRRPFILWLTSPTSKEKEGLKKTKKFKIMKNHKNKNHGRRAMLHRKFRLKHRHKIGGKKKKVHSKHK